MTSCIVTPQKKIFLPSHITHFFRGQKSALFFFLDEAVSPFLPCMPRTNVLLFFFLPHVCHVSTVCTDSPPKHSPNEAVPLPRSIAGTPWTSKTPPPFNSSGVSTEMWLSEVNDGRSSTSWVTKTPMADAKHTTGEQNKKSPSPSRSYHRPPPTKSPSRASPCPS